jgi:hypothetical protein
VRDARAVSRQERKGLKELQRRERRVLNSRSCRPSWRSWRPSRDARAVSRQEPLRPASTNAGSQGLQRVLNSGTPRPSWRSWRPLRDAGFRVMCPTALRLHPVRQRHGSGGTGSPGGSARAEASAAGTGAALSTGEVARTLGATHPSPCSSRVRQDLSARTAIVEWRLRSTSSTTSWPGHRRLHARTGTHSVERAEVKDV